MTASLDQSPNPPANSLHDLTAAILAAGNLVAEFLPTHGMLGVSLRHKDVEILRRIDDLATAAAKGSAAGVPLLHPWANRLAGFRYDAVGREVVLERSSPVLHFDDNGLPIHGVPWSKLGWSMVEQASNRVVAQLDWSRPDLLAVFPFPHRLAFEATLTPDDLTVTTTLIAGSDGAVPVSFGFHPYIGIPDLPRARWRLHLPPMRQLVLDREGIPTGNDVAFGGFSAELGTRAFDDGFALLEETTALGVSGAGYSISVEWLGGYRYAQVFAPAGKNYLALEPMTAPTNALISGQGLRLVAAGERFQASFRIAVRSAG